MILVGALADGDGEGGAGICCLHKRLLVYQTGSAYCI